jgi:hypothetical protein
MLISQILKLIPRIEFEHIAKETGTEYATKGFSSWSSSSPCCSASWGVPTACARSKAG